MDNSVTSYEVTEKLNIRNNIPYERKVMELRAELDSRLNSITEWYGKQLELDKNNDEQLIAIDKLQKTEFEYNEKRAKVIKEYLDKISKLIPDRLDIVNASPCRYMRARYIGEVKKYNKILTGLDYYLKILETGEVEVYNDAKFESFLLKIPAYDHAEWVREVVDIW